MVSPPPSQSIPSWLALPGLPPITRRSSYTNPRRILHLDRPGSRAHNAGQPVDLDIVGFQRANAVPVRLLHPAFVAFGILRAVVNNGPAAQHLHVLHLPQIQAAEDVRARSQVDRCRRSSDSGSRDARPRGTT